MCVADFSLDSKWIGLNVAIVNVGNLIIGPAVGLLMDFLGRKKAIWLSNALAIIGVAIQASAQNSEQLTVLQISVHQLTSLKSACFLLDVLYWAYL